MVGAMAIEAGPPWAESMPGLRAPDRPHGAAPATGGAPASFVAPETAHFVVITVAIASR